MWVSMPDLVDVLGRDMATTLAHARGGVSLYVPANANSLHDLAKIIGLLGLKALCAEFGGQYITVPNGRREPHKQNIHKLLKLGRSARAIAQECGVTERYVYYISRHVPKQEQLTLF